MNKTRILLICAALLLLLLSGCDTLGNTDAVSYPLMAAIDGVFGESTDSNPPIDNIESRIRSMIGDSDYMYAVGNTAYLDGMSNHWQGLAMSHLDALTLYLSKSHIDDVHTFNYAHLDEEDPDNDWYLLEYQDDTEPAYYSELHGGQDHANHIQAIGQYLLFSHLDLSLSPENTYLEILDLSTDEAYGNLTVKPSLKSIRLTTDGFSDVDYIGNAGILKLDTGHYLIVDTVYTKLSTNALDDFLGFQVYLSDTTDIAGEYSHMWSLPLSKIIFDETGLPAFSADNNVRYQGVDLIAQTDGTIYMAATRPEAIDLYEFTAESENIDDVQATLVAQLGDFTATETTAFQFGGSVMVWEETNGDPCIRILCIESYDGDNYPLDTHSYVEMWLNN